MTMESLRPRSRMISLMLLGALLVACAGRLRPGSRADRSPVPVWLATLAGCDRGQLDRDWQARRYRPLAGNDSACVALGRFGEPEYISESHDSNDATMLSMNWPDLPGIGSFAASAVHHVSTGGVLWPSYFQVIVNRATPPKAPDTSHVAVAIGSVLDSLGHGPGRPLRICALRVHDGSQGDTTRRCVDSDAGGGFRIDSLPTREVFVQISCVVPPFIAQTLFTAAVRPERRPRAAQLSIVSFKGCDTRPLRAIHATVSGHWSSGFEEGRFVPCPRDSWRVPADSLAPRRRGDAVAWVYSLPRDLTTKWWTRHSGPHDYTRDGYGSIVRFVRWRGTITGPGSYGHMGVSEWRIDVDSIITMRAPGPRDCK